MLKRLLVLFNIAAMFFVALTTESGRRKALIVVDFQNDFADPKGALYVIGSETITGIINLIIWTARRLGWLIIFTRDWHPEKTNHFNEWPKHCIANSWGSKFYPTLHVPNNSVFVFKGVNPGEDGYSGFDGETQYQYWRKFSSLAELLHYLKVEAVYVCGLALDYCVKATCLDAKARGFITYLISFATCAVNIKPDDDARALLELKVAGVKII